MKNKVIILALVVALGGIYYFYHQSQNLKQLQQNPQTTANQSTKDLIGKVSKLIVLPQGEDPTIATVTDPDKLKSQPFFAAAKQGYKVLVYTKAQRAILYDPSGNKIVEVAPINTGSSTGSY